MRINFGLEINAEEDEWGIPALSHTLIEDVEHRVVFVETYLQSGIGAEGDVAQDDAETYGHQQQRLEVFLDGEPDADDSHQYHDEVSCRGIGKACIGQELLKILYDEIHNSCSLSWSFMLMDSW